MSMLGCVPLKDLLASSCFGKRSSSFDGIHGKNLGPTKQEGNQRLSVRSCDKSTPVKKVRISSKSAKTDTPGRNVISRKEHGVQPSGETKNNSGGFSGRAEVKIKEVVQEKRDEQQRIHEGGLDKRLVASDAPLVDALRKCAAHNTAPFHFPGHHRGGAAPPLLVDAVGREVFAHDLPELPELDNLFAPAGVIAEAQKKAALAFGADATFFLVNGTTCGIQAAVMATCKPGDVLILPRNCHLSAISAMVLSGTLPWYVIPTYDSTWDLSHGVSRESIEDAVSQVRATGGRVGAVLIVSPTYYGVCSPLDEIAKVCHDNEVPLIVDEAHGAHFRFHPDLPSTALSQGADIAVQSTHKVLGSLTQSSMLHVGKGGRVDQALLVRCLQMVQSSSPSYLLLSSLDAARTQMNVAIDDNPGVFSSALLEPAIDLAIVARECLREIPNIVVMDEVTIQEARDLYFELDPLRITVGLWRLNVDGYQADEVLRLQFGVIAELPAMQSITFAIDCGTTARDVARLVEAMRALSLWYSKDHNYITMEEAVNPLRGDEDLVRPLLELPSGAALSPRDAFFCKTIKLDAEHAVGQISAELLCPYPPGIPVITPGEIITENALAYLRSILSKGGTISGASDPALCSISVCQR